ncbi:MAG TPA: hypothetical protein VMZ25_02400 [Terriglobales bacterium]|nr:hypothetical protein [Terriglobales bacterium]
MVTKLKKCPGCLGRGICDDGSKCAVCEGTGEIAHGEEIFVEEPCWSMDKDPDSAAS